MMIERLIASVELFYVSYFSIALLLHVAFGLVALMDLTRYRRRIWPTDLHALRSGVGYQPISILVPARNERETIVPSVRSLLKLDYPEFEVVVINDGSTDDTLRRLREAYGLVPLPWAWPVHLRTRPIVQAYRSAEHRNLIVLDKAPGGKGDALNAGINVSQYPLFCSLDADSLLQSDSLLRIARSFAEDERIIAAGGIIRVLNGATVRDGEVHAAHAPRSWLVLAQAQEYVRGFLSGRTALGRWKWLLILSGAFALFRKNAVIDAGGFRSDTVTEDIEIIVRMLRRAREQRLAQRIIFVPDPVCWTQIPSDLRSLLRQRDRWQRGLWETIWIHRGVIFNPRYGRLGLGALPFHLVFEALGPVIELAGYVVALLLLVTGRLDVGFALGFVAIAFASGLGLSILALLLDDLLFRRYASAGDLALMMAGAVLEFVGYRQLLAVQRTLALFGLLDRRRRWGRIRRTTIDQGAAGSRMNAACRGHGRGTIQADDGPVMNAANGPVTMPASDLGGEMVGRRARSQRRPG